MCIVGVSLLQPQAAEVCMACVDSVSKDILYQDKAVHIQTLGQAQSYHSY